MKEQDLDAFIAREYKRRLIVYDLSDWFLATVSVDEVGVWERAGGLPLEWTNGSLKKTATHVRKAILSTSLSRTRARRVVLAMLESNVEDIQSEKYLLPIVFKGGTGTKGRRLLSRQMKGDIDDGCMRSVALAVNGARTLKVYFGVPKKFSVRQNWEILFYRKRFQRSLTRQQTFIHDARGALLLSPPSSAAHFPSLLHGLWVVIGNLAETLRNSLKRSLRRRSEAPRRPLGDFGKPRDKGLGNRIRERRNTADQSHRPADGPRKAAARSAVEAGAMNWLLNGFGWRATESQVSIHPAAAHSHWVAEQALAPAIELDAANASQGIAG
jgi:hypothetical protein